ASTRNNVGYEIDPLLEETIHEQILNSNLHTSCNDYLQKRILQHLDFVEKRKALKGEKAFKYESLNYGFPVITRQEVKILFEGLKAVKSSASLENGIAFEAEHEAFSLE
ncbi:MAG: hypothetical protein AB8B69_18725, partial [Chitinophagales bacterium]